MRFIREINPETKKMLNRIYKFSKNHEVRRRAQAVLLSYDGKTIEELILIFKVTRKTIYNWFTSWEDKKLIGLYNRKGRGRKPLLKPLQKQEVIQWVKKHPKNLNTVVNKINQEWGIRVSKETVKRTIKQQNFTWRRVKKKVAGSPWPWEIEDKVEELNKLKKLDKAGEVDLRYLDESGFSLKSNIPYAWQDKKEQITINSTSSKRLNIIGIMNHSNEFYGEMHEGIVTSDIVIKCLDNFSNQIKKKTVIVMDQASIHTSQKFLEKVAEWKLKNLEIFWLPPYSPELNLIEILWRFMKYEWIEISAYDSWLNLKNYVKKVVSLIGTEYVINFA
jgi:transposase